MPKTSPLLRRWIVVTNAVLLVLVTRGAALTAQPEADNEWTAGTYSDALSLALAFAVSSAFVGALVALRDEPARE